MMYFHIYTKFSKHIPKSLVLRALLGSADTEAPFQDPGQLPLRETPAALRRETPDKCGEFCIKCYFKEKIPQSQTRVRFLWQ